MKREEEKTRVQRITDWEGARYSFLPARAADDLSLKLVHMRVLVYLGRVNNNHGWTELSQKATAERWDYSRQSVNGAIGDLVEWGYVEKRSQAETKTAVCFYRLLIDKIEKPDDGKKPDAPNPNSGDVSGVGDTSQNAAVSGVGDTGVGSDPTGVSPIKAHKKDQRSGALSPKPPKGARGRGKVSVDEVAAILRDLEAEASGDAARLFAIGRVLQPIATQRHLDAPSPSSALRSRADWIAKFALTDVEAATVVDRLLTERRSTVKPSDIDDAVKLVVNNRPAARVLAGDPELMAKWPIVLGRLEKLLDVDRVKTFSTFVLERIAPPNRSGRVIAHVATHVEWARRSVELSMSAQFRAALCAAFPDVTDVFIETRRIAA